MADNFQITEGSGRTIGAVDPGTGFLEQKIQVTVSALPAGASTESTLAAIKAKTDNLDVALSTRTKPADTQKVDGSSVTQPISAASLPLPSGAATDTTFTARINTQGQKTMAASTPVVIASDQSPFQIAQIPATLVVTGTAATGVGVTVTLPAVVSQFHYITFLEIKKYFTAANAASATPLVVTTTNLPGSLAFSFGQPLGTIGSTDRDITNPNCPIKSSVVNTATTIVCPATTGIIWRVNVFYYTAA